MDASLPARVPGEATPVEVKQLTMAYGSHVVMHDLSFQVRRGEVFVDGQGEQGSGAGVAGAEFDFDGQAGIVVEQGLEQVGFVFV
jgi:ABC-type phosphonate transport system ATPase subunit